MVHIEASQIRIAVLVKIVRWLFPSACFGGMRFGDQTAIALNKPPIYTGGSGLCKEVSVDVNTRRAHHRQGA